MTARKASQTCAQRRSDVWLSNFEQPRVANAAPQQPATVQQQAADGQALLCAQHSGKHSKHCGNVNEAGRFGRVALIAVLLMDLLSTFAGCVMCLMRRLLRQRSSMLPTIVGRSSRHALMAFRAMHHTLAIFGLGELGNLLCTEPCLSPASGPQV